jgi:hypothetical protein
VQPAAPSVATATTESVAIFFIMGNSPIKAIVNVTHVVA